MSTVKFVDVSQVYDHPTLETLGIVQVELPDQPEDGCLVVVKKGELTPGEKALFFPVGTTVANLPEFGFLKNKTIEPADFDDVQSQGLIIPVPDWYKVGRDPDMIFLGASPKVEVAEPVAFDEEDALG